MGGKNFAATAAAVAALVGCGGGGAGDDGGVHLTGNVVTAVGVISSSGRTPRTTLIDVEFTERGDLTIPDAGSCQEIPTTVDPKAMHVGAGMVTFAGASEPTILTQTTTAYSFEDLTHAAWSAGATLTLNVTGSAAVPAFTTSAEAPGPLTIKSPVSNGAPVVVERAHGLGLSWEPLSNGRVLFGLLGSDKEDGHPIEIECLFDGGDGAATLPPAVLSTLATGLASLSGDAINLETSRAGSWSVAFLLGESPGGAIQLELE